MSGILYLVLKYKDWNRRGGGGLVETRGVYVW